MAWLLALIAAIVKAWRGVTPAPVKEGERLGASSQALSEETAANVQTTAAIDASRAADAAAVADPQRLRDPSPDSRD